MNHNLLDIWALRYEKTECSIGIKVEIVLFVEYFFKTV